MPQIISGPGQSVSYPPGNVDPITTATNGAVIQGGSIVAANSGSTNLLVISAGGTAIDVDVINGNIPVVVSGVGSLLSGGTITDTAAQGSAAMLVVIKTGGVASGVTLNGVTGGTTVSGAAQPFNPDPSLQLIGGTALDTIVSHGHIVVGETTSGGGNILGSGVASGSTVIAAGNFITEASAGTSFNTLISGASEFVGGTALDSTIKGSGTQGGTQIVQGDNNPADTRFGGTGYTAHTTVSSGGTQIVTAASGGAPVTAGAGTSFETVVSASGVQYVVSGGVASGSTADSGGLVVVSNATLAAPTNVVSTGGRIELYNASGSGSTITTDGSGVITGVQSNLAVVQIDDEGGGSHTISQTIDNFVYGDALDFKGISDSGLLSPTSGLLVSGGTTHLGGLEIIQSGDTLIVSGNGEQYTLNVPNIGMYGATLFDDGSGDLLFEICFAEGTMIATPSGETAVEQLSAGDMVMTLNGVRPVKWIGHRSVDLSRLADPEVGRLVRIRENAFGQGLPKRDLLVTQEHAIYVDGNLIPVRMLVNERSISIDRGINAYTYYHVELEQHGILMAEGLTTESYLDTGNRPKFANAEAVSLRPDFLEHAAHRSWEEDAAAPLVTDRAVVEPVWQRLDQRADRQGYRPRTAPSRTSDPQVQLMTEDGTTIAPILTEKDAYAFLINGNSGALRLVSRTWKPSEMVGPFVDDRRNLGVLVGEIGITTGRKRQPVRDHLEGAKIPGWHDLDPGAALRWTNGKALLPINLEPFKGTQVYLDIRVIAGGPYPADVADNAQRTRAA
jgi:antigen 43